MVKHIVMFRFKDDFPLEARAARAEEIRERSLALKDQIPGIRELRVEIAPQGTSTHSFMLEGVFDDLAALDAYQSHPAHQAVGVIIKEAAGERACFDYLLD